MKNQPKISVIMSVFNGEKYIEQSVNSILNQTFGDFEFIIIDDGSTDNTFKILESYKDERIKLIKNEPFEKLIQTSSKKIIINISYLPYWQIYINNKTYYPKNIDQFGRPIVKLNNNIKKEIKIKYQQTIIQKIANILSLISFLLILKFLWKIKKI